jgi:ubiquinone/menaquinone biosynthesis C-methylase UbiE
MWRKSIYPRIKRLLPAATILEIAPGFGRCTAYLKNHCERLVIVDLSPKCIEACKRRFANESNISYYVNDGKSLDMIADRSIDFVFSFDSLVHAQADVMEAYVKQLAVKLKPSGQGFIHHSNLGSYRGACFLSRYFRKLGAAGRTLGNKGLLIIDQISRLAKLPLCQCLVEIQKPPTAKCENRYAIHLVFPGHLKSWRP